MATQKITPFLWFDANAEEAATFYTSVFKDSKIGKIVRYGKAGPGPEGSALTISIELFGQAFTLLNAGPIFKFNEAVSFVINCETQNEVDEYWNALSGNGGQESQCGWLKDKFGLSWQVVPKALTTLLGDKDPQKSSRVMQAMLKMKKIDIKTLERAYVGEAETVKS